LILADYSKALSNYNLYLLLDGDSVKVNQIAGTEKVLHDTNLQGIFYNLKLDKPNIWRELTEIEMQRLMSERVKKVSQLKGWDNVDAAKLKETDPKLYAEWLESEYRCDERFGKMDLEGLRQALAHYEIVNFKVVSRKGGVT